MGGAMNFSDDRAALQAACKPGVGLCTIVGIEGSFSRRLGAQLAVLPDGSVVGSLADGCLERQLAVEISTSRAPVIKRFGRGSSMIDFRLPCGSGLDLLIDPAPDRAACAAALAACDAREEAVLPLPPIAQASGLLHERRYMPAPRLLVFGEGPEPDALTQMALAGGVQAEHFSSLTGLSLGKAPQGIAVDAWTAIVLLYHDHEWEVPILDWALSTPAYFLGAQGGIQTRAARIEGLAAKGHGASALARVHSPIGLIPRTREPAVLGLSVLAQVIAEYERLHPHG